MAEPKVGYLLVETEDASVSVLVSRLIVPDGSLQLAEAESAELIEIGSSSRPFSDLFLEEGGVISWDNGDVTITQTNNVLAIAGTSYVSIVGTAASLGNSPDIRYMFSGDADAALSYLVYDHNNVSMAFDAYFDGSNWISSNTGSNFALRKVSDVLGIYANTGTTKGSSMGSGFDTADISFFGNGGMTIGAPTGGNKGSGSLNAVTIWRNGTSLDYVFEPGYNLFTIDEMSSFFRQHKHLPTILTRKVHSEGSTNEGALVDALWETVECQAIYIVQLHERLREVEKPKEKK